MRTVVASAAAVVLALVVLGPARPAVRTTPSTALAINGPVDGLALDGDHFVDSGGKAFAGCPTVELGTFGSAAHRLLGAEVPGAPDVDGCDADPLLLALGGSRAVWGGFEDCCNSGYGDVTTGAPGAKPRALAALGQNNHDLDGDRPASG